MPSPNENRFLISQDGDIRTVARYGPYTDLRQIQFNVDAATKTTLGYYGIINFEIILVHPSKARISQLSINKITLTHKSIPINFENTSQISPNTSLCNCFLYKLRLTCSNDFAQESFTSNGIITIEFMIQITSGLRYKQIIEFNYTKFTNEKIANYRFEIV